MRRPLFAITALGALALGAAAQAQDAAAPAGRMLSWPGKTARAVQPVEAAEAPEASQLSTLAPPPVPAPFVSYAPGQAPRVNNRYSPRSGALRPAARAVTPAPYMPAPAVASLPRPAYTPPVRTAPVYAPPPMAAPQPDYGPPVVPNVIRPAAPVLAQPRAAPPVAAPAPSPVVRAEAPLAPVKSSKPVRAAAAPTPQPSPAAPPAAVARNTERPFVRPAQGSGPRFYSVHREFGQQPDAAQRSVPGATAAAAERLPSAFFADTPAPADEDQVEADGQDDAETRNAAIRAEVKRQVAAQPNRRRR